MKPPFDQRKPFVGLGGTGNTIAVTYAGNKIICRLSSRVYWVVLSATAFFGPGVCALLWLRPRGAVDLSEGPIYMAALILTLPAVCCLLFVYYLLNRHRLEVDCESGDILFYQRRGGRPIFRLGGRDIERFEISAEWYTPSDGGGRVKNYVLSAVADGGERIALCLSTRGVLIRWLAGEMARPASRPVVDAAA